MKKINFKNVSSVLSEKEMKNVMGGFGGDGKCAYEDGAGNTKCAYGADSADFMSGGGWWCCNCADARHCVDF
jgi:natural product precursor